MKAIKVLHIDEEYRVVYVLIRDGALIKSPVQMETAIAMLNTEVFDLILFEPQNLAILTPQQGLAQGRQIFETAMNSWDPNSFQGLI
jgi:hypothetical protein